MKIRIRYIVLIVVAFLIIGYIVGAVWPMKMFQFEVSDTPITKGDHRANLINVIVALGTLLAVAVALFKDDIVGWFKKVHIVLNPENDKALEELDGNAQHPKASRYYNNIIIKNDGTANALDCEFNITKMEFKRDGNMDYQNIDFLTSQLKISQRASNVYIPIKGEKKIQIFEISNDGVPSEEDVDKLILKIGENTIKQPNICNGVWRITCELLMKNSTPINCEIDIEWNGEWKDRVSEFQIKTSLKY